MFYKLAFEENSSAHAWNYIDMLSREKKAKRAHVQWIWFPLLVQTIFIKKDNQSDLTLFVALDLIIRVYFVRIFVAQIKLFSTMQAIIAWQLNLFCVQA